MRDGVCNAEAGDVLVEQSINRTSWWQLGLGHFAKGGNVADGDMIPRVELGMEEDRRLLCVKMRQRMVDEGAMRSTRSLGERFVPLAWAPWIVNLSFTSKPLAASVGILCQPCAAMV